MTSKSVVISRVFKHYMGAVDFISGDFKNKTRSILKKLEISLKTVDSLIDSKILKVRVIFTDMGETWDPVHEPLVVFPSDRTHWEFWTEDFNDYLIRTEGNNNDQSSVLLEQRKSLTLFEKETLKKWLLEG